MKVFKSLISISLLLILLFRSSCSNESSLHIKSDRAGGGGEKEFVIDLSCEKKEYDISQSRTITFTMGLGGTGKRVPGKRHSMTIQIQADDCIINGKESHYEHEYMDFFEDEIYTADEKDPFWGYPEKFPNYFESIEIVFPSGEHTGRIDFVLYNKNGITENETAELTVYYAKNDIVLLVSDNPVYIRDLDN